MKREFLFNGTRLADPDPSLTPEQAKNMLAANYPELTNATINAPVEKNGKQVYEFKKAVGTKG